MHAYVVHAGAATHDTAARQDGAAEHVGILVEAEGLVPLHRGEYASRPEDAGMRDGALAGRFEEFVQRVDVGTVGRRAEGGCEANLVADKGKVAHRTRDDRVGGRRKRGLVKLLQMARVDEIVIVKEEHPITRCNGDAAVART